MTVLENSGKIGIKYHEYSLTYIIEIQRKLIVSQLKITSHIWTKGNLNHRFQNNLSIKNN